MKKNIIPLFLLLLMIFSIIGACVFKHWSFMFLAAEFILFHLVPPFTVLLSMLAYNKKLKVKQWKNKLPTYDSSLFAINAETKESVIKSMIQAENVHLLLFFLSFVPVLLSLWFGYLWLMLLMAALFAVMHLPFIIIQRFNLPRILRMRSENF